MKRLERLLVPMIMVGILVLSGCVAMDSTSGLKLPHQPVPQAAGGSTSGPSFKQVEIPVDKAVVYIYRSISPTFGADVKIPFDVKANGKVEITLVQGGYYAYFTEPGQIEFTAFDTGFMAPKSTFSITVDAKAGQAYYLKGAHGHGLGGRAKLVLVSPEVGANEIANCKLTTQ